MKKTIQINLGGRHFHMDEDAFQKLNHYLDSLKAHFAAEGETGKEILEDIEQRIAELLEKKITDGTQAVSLEYVNEVIAILGKIEDFEYAGAGAARDYENYGRRDNRRFFRDEENNYIGGVAAGLGAYFDIDPLWLRLAFIALIFLHGLGILVYVILWIVVPKARTTTEKLQMHGIPVTLSSIKDSVNAEYGRVKTGIHNINRSPAAERTRNAVENLFRAIGLVFVAILKFIIGIIGVTFLMTGTIFLALMVMFLLGFTHVFGHFQMWDGFPFPFMSHFFLNPTHYTLLVIALVILVMIPIIALIYGGIKILFNIRTRHNVLRASLLITWVVALVFFISILAMNSTNFAAETSGKQTRKIEINKYPRLYIEVWDNSEDKRMTHYSVFDQEFEYSQSDKSLYSQPNISIENSEAGDMSVTVLKRLNNVGIKKAQDFIDRINYNWEQKDSVIYIDKYLSTSDNNFWMFARVNLDLRIPENQVVILSDGMCELMNFDQQYQYCN
ncbi:MAG TPA: PspC domain-containing protein, partial [Bacteroidales bacterium]|nr:PspC domain-containing protein [Bacteroidales bacterium]